MQESLKKLLFIYNPKAGKGAILQKLSTIIDLFTAAGYLVTAYPTQKRADATNLVLDETLDSDLIVCSGGDGTLNEVVTGMMKREKKIPIGYIPAGSTNDFASSLEIPKRMLEAAETAIGPSVFKSDIGSLNGKYFVYAAAFGLFSEVSYMTPQDMKNLLGHSAYIIEGAKSLANIPEYHIIADGDNLHIDGHFILGMITNTYSIGGFRRLFGSDVSLDDGYHELTLAKAPETPAEFQELITCLFNGKLREASIVQTAEITSLHITSDQPISWSLDGEFGGEYTEVDIQNNKQAIELKI